MTTPAVTATDEGQGRKYWTQVPNIVLDLGLRPIPLALYLHLKRVAGDTSFSDETTRQLADRLECSPMAVSRALVELADPRDGLGGKALVKVARISDGKGTRKPRIIVTIADIWPENMAKYGTPAVTIVDGTEGEAVNNSYGNDESRNIMVRDRNTMVRRRNIMVHPKEQEEPKELKDIAASTDDAGATPNGTASATPRKRKPSKPKADDAPKTPRPVPPHVALVDAMYDALGQTEHRDYPLNVKDAKAMLEAEYTPADVTRITAGLMRDRGAFYAANRVALNMALVRKNAAAYPAPTNGTALAGGAAALNGYAKYAYTVPSTGRLAMKSVAALRAEELAPATAEQFDRGTWTDEMRAAEAAIQGVMG